MDLFLVWKLSATFNLSKNDQWETPPDLFQLGCDYFDFEPTLDLCATNFDKKCKLFIKNYALDMDWDCNSWLNPPYSNVKDEFVICKICFGELK